MTAKTNVRVSSRAKEIEALKARIAELESELSPTVAENKEGKIALDEYIPVMSLLPYRLNLSTKEFGTGDVKKFANFGEVKKILYKDLVDILEVNSHFMEAGYFYILDPRVIRQHGLDETYSKILTKEKIDEILSTNSENCVSLYDSANNEQKRVIIQLLVEKIKENPSSVNLNVIDRISRISEVSIAEIAREAKEFQTLIEQPE